MTFVDPPARRASQGDGSDLAGASGWWDGVGDATGQGFFFFHTTTAYDILRHKGAPIGKRDFMGKLKLAA